MDAKHLVRVKWNNGGISDIDSSSTAMTRIPGNPFGILGTRRGYLKFLPWLHSNYNAGYYLYWISTNTVARGVISYPERMRIFSWTHHLANEMAPYNTTGTRLDRRVPSICHTLKIYSSKKLGHDGYLLTKEA